MKQAHWESATQKDLSNRDSSGCYLDDKGKGYKLSFVWFLFLMKTSTLSSLYQFHSHGNNQSHHLPDALSCSLIMVYHNIANSALSLFLETAILEQIIWFRYLWFFQILKK